LLGGVNSLIIEFSRFNNISNVLHGGLNVLFSDRCLYYLLGAIYKSIRSLQGPNDQNGSRILGCNITNCSATLGGGIFVQHVGMMIWLFYRVCLFSFIVVIALIFLRFENNSATQGLDVYHANYSSSNETFYSSNNVIDCCSNSGMWSSPCSFILF
jgi:hypothetical protein